MEKMIKGQHYIKEWREYRKISLRDLANRLEVSDGGDLLLSHASISRIEKGEQPFTEETLNALAFALDVDRIDLLSKNPHKDGEVIDLMRKLNETDKTRIIDMMRLLIKTS